MPRHRLATLPLVAALLLCLGSTRGFAAPCPAVGDCGGNPFSAMQWGFNSTVTALAPSPVTATVMCGAVVNCQFLYNSLFGFATATWASTSARLMDADGACVIYQNGMANACKVGPNGLPVELLQFGVE